MLLLYVWRPGDDAAPDAAARFDAVVAAEQNACEGWTGLPVESRSRSAGGGFVGLIGPDLGIEGHTGWYDDDGRGFAWLGVCEDFLGQPAEETSRAIGALDADPATVVGWTGRFALSRWDTRAGRLELMTAATESPSLWWANGPGGWAAGSRPGVVRRLAGVEARLDLNQARLVSVFGYHMAEGSLYEGVRRLPSRTRVTLEPGSPTELRRFASIGDVTGPIVPRRPGDAVTEAASRLVERVTVQLRHSPSPVLLLTGGRDSRCLAAAAATAGFQGTISTSGGRTSPDVMIAAQVAARLGLRQQGSSGPRPGTPTNGSGTPPKAAVPDLDAALDWARRTEGRTTFEFAVPLAAAGGGAAGHGMAQIFHGLGGELARASLYPPFGWSGRPSRARIRRTLMRRGSLDLVPETALAPVLDAVLDAFEPELEDLGHEGDLARYLDVFYWQNRNLHFGSDLLAVNDVRGWHWTPLFDRLLVQIVPGLPAATKVDQRFAADLAVELSPALAGLPYDKSASRVRRIMVAVVKDGLGRLGRLNPRLAGRLRPRVARLPAAALAGLWQQVFFDAPLAWPELVAERDLRRLVADYPNSTALWGLATVELFARANLG